MIITCKRRPLIIRGEESYEVRAAGRLLSDNVRDPLTDGARILLAEGVDPAEPLVLRQRLRGGLPDVTSRQGGRPACH